MTDQTLMWKMGLHKENILWTFFPLLAYFIFVIRKT